VTALELGIRIKRNDYILIALLLLLAGGLFLSSQFIGARGDRVNIAIDGVHFHTYPLNENREVVIKDLHMGQLTLLIKDSSVSVKESSCPDLFCVKHRAVNKTGESIICLPNRVAIEIVGGESNVPDAITR
jgi:hypothetical protein